MTSDKPEQHAQSQRARAEQERDGPKLDMRERLSRVRVHAPGKRPYLISRSGAPGRQRHAQTWSGDNRTAWKTIRYNIRTGLGMSLSGFYNVGHDVGGFSGPRPGPELFLRWIQNGIFHPRFTIHSGITTDGNETPLSPDDHRGDSRPTRTTTGT